MSNMKCRPVEGMSEQSIKNFWSHVNKRGQIRVESLGPCWEWTASKFESGYGQFKGGPSTRAHRVAYELVIGPCPEGLESDHLCNFPGCVNPSHLDWITHGENLSRRGNRARWGLDSITQPKPNTLRKRRRREQLQYDERPNERGD